MNISQFFRLSCLKLKKIYYDSKSKYYILTITIHKKIIESNYLNFCRIELHRYIERTKRARTESKSDATKVYERGRAGSEAAEAICYARFPRFRRRLSPPLDQSSSVLFLPPPSSTLAALAVALFYIARERLNVFNRDFAFSVTRLNFCPLSRNFCIFTISI